MSPKKLSRKGLLKKLDNAWKAEAKARVPYCEYGAWEGAQSACSQPPLHVHHIVSRTVRATQFDLRNSCVLCQKHHLYGVHRDVLHYAEFFQATRADDVEYLKVKRREIVKWSDADLMEILESLST